MKLFPITILVYSQLLLQLVSAEAFPALDPCWRQYVTHQLPCADGQWTCYCRTARRTSLFADSLTCIRQTCTAGRPFDPITLLTPFQENCKKPLAPSIYANANALAAQDPAISPTTAPHLSSTTRGGNTDDTQPSSVPAAPPPASIMTTTYIGIATHPNGAQETYTVPALVGPTRTIFGSPVTKAPGTAKPTSTVTLPWSIPAPASSTKHSTTLATSSARAPSLTSSSSSPTTASGTSKTGTGASGNDGTVLDADNSSVLQHSAGSSLLGLMIVVLVAVIWF